jgi:hypothetical protein
MFLAQSLAVRSRLVLRGLFAQSSYFCCKTCLAASTTFTLAAMRLTNLKAFRQLVIVGLHCAGGTPGPSFCNVRDQVTSHFFVVCALDQHHGSIMYSAMASRPANGNYFIIASMKKSIHATESHVPRIVPRVLHAGSAWFPM